MTDIKGGIDYALLRRHYGNVDFVQLAVTATPQSYVVGTMAYLADTTLPTTKEGWTPFTPAVPIPLLYQALGITSGPAFGAKDILFYCTQDCYVRFESPIRVQLLIPANTYMRFHPECLLVFYVVRVTADGILSAWIEG